LDGGGGDFAGARGEAVGGAAGGGEAEGVFAGEALGGSEGEAAEGGVAGADGGFGLHVRRAGRPERAIGSFEPEQASGAEGDGGGFRAACEQFADGGGCGFILLNRVAEQRFGFGAIGFDEVGFGFESGTQGVAAGVEKNF
jgi:hypothetical protein